jgi:hypothetical protein
MAGTHSSLTAARPRRILTDFPKRNRHPTDRAGFAAACDGKNRTEDIDECNARWLDKTSQA